MRSIWATSLPSPTSDSPTMTLVILGIESVPPCLLSIDDRLDAADEQARDGEIGGRPRGDAAALEREGEVEKRLHALSGIGGTRERRGERGCVGAHRLRHGCAELACDVAVREGGEELQIDVAGRRVEGRTSSLRRGEAGEADCEDVGKIC